jgi:hypothetical protein
VSGEQKLTGHEHPFLHWCEVCGREEILSSEAAYSSGWDFPPKMGAWGVVSPRTCPDCGIESTVWWAAVVEKRTVDDMTTMQRRALDRILDEVPPGSGNVSGDSVRPDPPAAKNDARQSADESGKGSR